MILHLNVITNSLLIDNVMLVSRCSEWHAPSQEVVKVSVGYLQMAPEKVSPWFRSPVSHPLRSHRRWKRQH